MKKSMIAAMGGLALGLVIMVGVFVIMQVKTNVVNANNHQQSEQNANTGQNIQESESIFGTEDWFGSENLFETEELFETESEVETEIILETEDLTETESDTVSENIDTSESGVTSESQVTESEEKSAASEKTETQNVDYPYYIRVNRQANCVTIYTKDEEGNYSIPIKAMACSVGLTGNTPLGVSKITDKYNWRLLFGNVYGQYSVRFNGHILFHSVPYTSITKDALKEGEYNLLGQPASQGCVRLSCADAKWIYDNCRKGTQVEVYDSADPGPLGKPQTIKISSYSPYKGWDPTDPDPRNPWKNGEVTIYGVQSVITINQGDLLDLLAGVSATDIDGLPLVVDVLGNVDVNTPGMYDITYLAESVIGTQKTVAATVVVNAVEIPETESELPGETETGTESELPEISTDSEVTEEPETGIGSELPEEPETGLDTELPQESETSTATEVVGEPETGINTDAMEEWEASTATEIIEETETSMDAQLEE